MAGRVTQLTRVRPPLSVPVCAKRGNFSVSRSMTGSSAKTPSSLLVLRTATMPQKLGNARASRVVPVYMGRRSAKIAGRKGKEDAARAKVYARICKQIVQSAKSGGVGSDNSQLQEILKVAKQNGVPRDLVDRNLKKATEKNQQDFAELTYEAYAFGGIGLVIESLTDNKNRAAADVASVVKKAGGKMAESGSVMFQFERKGLLTVESSEEEEVFEVALEAGADDVRAQEGDEGEGEAPCVEVVTAPDAWGTVREALDEAGLVVDGARSGLRMEPMAMIETDDEAYDQNQNLIDQLLELDDVDAVYCNMAM